MKGEQPSMASATTAKTTMAADDLLRRCLSVTCSTSAKVSEFLILGDA